MRKGMKSVENLEVSSKSLIFAQKLIISTMHRSALTIILMCLCATLGAMAANDNEQEREAQNIITGIINDLYAAAASNEDYYDGRFACHTWIETVRAVEKKDSKLVDIGFFNEDYWTEMQDGNPDDLEARDIKFEHLDLEQGTATVSFTLYSSVQVVKRRFSFCREEGEWRIHDITKFWTDEDGKEVAFDYLEGMRDYLYEPKEMAVQLYSIRDVIGNAELYARNHAEVFRRLSEMGYTGIEAADYKDGKFYGVSPEQYRQDCEEAGLTPISSHVNRNLNAEELASHDFTQALEWWDKAIEAHKAAGIRYVVTSWGETPKTLKDGQTICDFYNEIGRRCREAGLSYGYHTHSHEFQKVEGQVWIDYMMQHTDAENVFWQMDTYWAVMAKQGPVHYFKKYPGRFKMLHIKDIYELGESGFVGFDAIFRNAGLAGLENYVVEMEGNDGTIDSMEGVRRCAEYLKAQDFVLPSYSK